jgi:phenylacetate-CoA ligase
MMSVIADEHLRPPAIQQILTAFQTVDPVLRERTRQTFGASIRDRYSCEEVGALAFQCPQSDEHYHVAIANAIVEVVDDDGNPCADGVRGNVLVTGLNQWASPAIRYAIGDVACAHVSCPGCGASAPALSDLLGRKAKLLSSPVRGLRFVRVLAEHWLACAPVREHLLVQTGETALRAELVLDRALQAAEKDALLAMLRKEIGEEFTFEVVQVPSIPMPNFKREEFVREIP